MAFKHYAIELPEDLPFDLIEERVQHALDTGREIGEQNDYRDGLEGEQIAAADAFIDMCRDSNINPLTGSEDDSPFAFMDSDEGDDPDDDWDDSDEDSEKDSEDGDDTPFDAHGNDTRFDAYGNDRRFDANGNYRSLR